MWKITDLQMRWFYLYLKAGMIALKFLLVWVSYCSAYLNLSLICSWAWLWSQSFWLVLCLASRNVIMLANLDTPNHSSLSLFLHSINIWAVLLYTIQVSFEPRHWLSRQTKILSLGNFYPWGLFIIMDWTFVFSQNSYVEIQSPQCDSIRRYGLWEIIR